MPAGKNNGSLVESFQFDDDGEWFNEGSTTTTTSSNNKVIGNTINDDDDVDDDDGVVEKIDNSPEAKAKEKAEQAEKKRKEDEAVNKLPTSKEGTKKPDKKKEEIEEEEEDNQPKNKGQKGKTKKQEDEEFDEEEEVEFFADPKKDEAKKGEQGKPKETTKEGTEDEVDYVALALALKDKGTLNFDISEEDEIDEDGFLDMFEEEAQSRAEEMVDALKDIDEEGKRFLKFKLSGGKTQDFTNVYSTSLDIDELDEEDDKQVQKVLRHYLTRIEGKTDEEEIQDRLTYWKESGKQKDKAKKYFAEIKKKEDAAKEKVITDAKTKAKERKESSIAFSNNLVDTLDKADKIGSFVIEDTDKKELPAYFLKPSVKLKDGSMATPFQVMLSKTLKPTTAEDTKNLLLLGKLFKDNFKVDIEAEVTTKVVKRTRAILNKHKKTPQMTSSGGGNSPKSLADLIN